jgi:lipid-A-disaccharide synthase
VRRGPARVLIVAGEASGDLYGSLLMRAMGGAGQAVEFAGIGGPSMRSTGLQSLGDAGALGVTGFLEVLGSARAIWGAYRGAGRMLSAPDSRPDLALLIDYPDFNLRLARKARGAGVPVLYFVSPQVWAWRKGRIGQIAGTVDRMLVILPFEEEFYRRAGVPVEFVGHPLLDLVRVDRTRDQALRPLGLDPSRPVVAMLPGSRANELQAHLPAMLEAAVLLRDEFRDLQFVIPVAPTLDGGAIRARVASAFSRGSGGGRSGEGESWALIGENRYNVIAASDAAVVASGTATLETALLGVPLVVVYRMNALTYALARMLSDVPHIGMPNLIAGERVAPELVQSACTGARIAGELRRILTDPRAAEAMRRGLAGVRSRLGRPGAISRVAAAAWDMIHAGERARAPGAAARVEDAAGRR